MIEVNSYSDFISKLTAKGTPCLNLLYFILKEKMARNLLMDKLHKAVELSEERYCGVTAVYKKVMELTSEIEVIEQ